MKSYLLIKVANANMCITINNRFKEEGIESNISTTPSLLGDGCGLSVKIDDFTENTRFVLKDICKDYSITIYKVNINDDFEYQYNIVEDL